MWENKEQITPGYSLSQVTVPVIQQEYTSDTCLRSTMENDTRGKSKISHYGNVKCFYLISIPKHSGHIAQFFNLIIRILFMLFAMQIKSFFLIFGCVLKTEGIEEAFLNFFHASGWMYSLGKKVFLKIVLWKPLFYVFVFFINSVQHTLSLQVGFDIQAII